MLQAKKDAVKVTNAWTIAHIGKMIPQSTKKDAMFVEKKGSSMERETQGQNTSLQSIVLNQEEEKN